MEHPVSFWSLRAKLIAGLFFILFASYGQSESVDTLWAENEITAFSQDRTGNIFLSYEGGAITKFSPAMDSLISFSPTKLGNISLLEAWHGFQIFAFYEEFQEFVLFDRFLTRDTRYTLSQSSASYADKCTISSDQNLWVFGEIQLLLLKINLTMRTVDIEVPLDFVLDDNEHNIVFLKEYQNLVFLVDKNSGIYIFDNFGNYLRKIDAPGINNCSFKDEHLFYLQNNMLHNINLYQGSHEKIMINPGDYLGVLPLANGFLLIKKDMVIKFTPTPN